MGEPSAYNAGAAISGKMLRRSQQVSINGSSDSETSTSKSCVTSRKANINVVTSEQISTCFPNTSEKFILENYQKLSDTLDCYSQSDLKETTGMQLNPVFNNHKEESILLMLTSKTVVPQEKV